MIVNDARAILSPLTPAAIFLVVCLKPGSSNGTEFRSFLSDLGGIFRAVETRDPDARLSCSVGFGSDAWDGLFGRPRPAELHPFREIRSGERHAVATPGDVLFDVRSTRADMCFELLSRVMDRIAGVVTVADETHGFRYFDTRDVLGFVDGTENPREHAAHEAALVGDEDPAFSGGSYVLVQKYLHDLAKWNAITIEEQERIIGRKKLSDIELSDSAKPPYAHNALTTIVENDKAVQIVRGNMPFGRPGYGRFGTYFIGYSRSPRTMEQMLQNMFVGNPPGNYDRLLDVSTTLTGSLFFVPSAGFVISHSSP